jgi:redox-sensitive bicupin YhaK (pirin superfamily)
MTFSHRGDQHSEQNGSEEEGLRFIQFWILPSEEGLETSVQQRQYSEDDRRGKWLQIMGPRGEEGLDLAQDARALVSRLDEGQTLDYQFPPGRGGYLYVIDGRATVNDEPLRTGDAVKIEGPERISLGSTLAAELILVEVPLEFEPVGVWAGRR